MTDATNKTIPVHLVDAPGLVPGAKQIARDKIARNPVTFYAERPLLSRSHFESGKSVFELNEGQHHDHLVCLTCGRVEEFFDPEIEVRQRAVAQAKGFELQDHALSLYAVCSKADCEYRPATHGSVRAPGSTPSPTGGGQ